MASDMRACPVEGIQEPDRVDLGHVLADLVGRQPLHGRGLVRRALLAARGLSEVGFGPSVLNKRAGGNENLFLQLLQRSAPIGVPVGQLDGTLDDRL